MHKCRAPRIAMLLYIYQETPFYFGKSPCSMKTVQLVVQSGCSSSNSPFLKPASRKKKRGGGAYGAYAFFLEGHLLVIARIPSVRTYHMSTSRYKEGWKINFIQNRRVPTRHSGFHSCDDEEENGYWIM